MGPCSVGATKRITHQCFTVVPHCLNDHFQAGTAGAKWRVHAWGLRPLQSPHPCDPPPPAPGRGGGRHFTVLQAMSIAVVCVPHLPDTCSCIGFPSVQISHLCVFCDIGRCGPFSDPRCFLLVTVYGTPPLCRSPPLVVPRGGGGASLDQPKFFRCGSLCCCVGDCVVGHCHLYPLHSWQERFPLPVLQS